jgi:hypothetical protein
MVWVWVILGTAIIAFVFLRVRQLRVHNERIAEHDPFNNFTVDATRTLTRFTPSKWKSSQDNPGKDRDQAVQTINDLIQRGGAIDTPVRQQVYQMAFLALLASFRDEWVGYPYEGPQGEAELEARKQQSEHRLAFYNAISRTLYPPVPQWRQKNWQAFLFGPGKGY